MKKSTLLNFSPSRSYVLVEKENGFRMDFSRGSMSSAIQGSVAVDSSRKKGLTSILLLLFVFLFTNFLFAQPPACNLSGPLKYELTDLLRPNERLHFTSDVSNAKPNTVYLWTFKTNNSDAAFEGSNRRNYADVNPGRKAGSFTVELKVVNPTGESCTCTQSVTLIRANKETTK